MKSAALRSFEPSALPRRSVVVLAFVLPFALFAQAPSSPVDSAPPRTPPSVTVSGADGGSDVTVTLSPFEVVAEDDGSYVSTHTLAGTRFNTELKDVPASLSVMTADFLRDIGAANLGEAMEYTIGAEQDFSDTTGNNRQSSDLQVRMRGFRNSTLGRNFFESDVAQDNYNTERVTFSRGPNSVLFGSGGAGGVADATTKRAMRKKLDAVTVRVGGFDDYRFELDVNRPVTKTLALRVNTLVWNRKGWRDFESMDRKSVALATTWRPSSKTTVRLDAEFGQVNELRAQPWPVFDAVSAWVAGGRTISATSGASVTGATATVNTPRPIFISNAREFVNVRGSRQTTPTRSSDLGGFNTTFEDESIVPFSANVFGPGATSNNNFRDTSLVVEHQLMRNLFLEIAARQQHTERDWNRALFWNDGRLLADPNAQRPDRSANPYVGQYYVETSRSAINRQNQTSNDYRITASYQFELGRAGRHQIAGLLSRRDRFNRTGTLGEAWINNPAEPKYNAAANNIVRRTYLSFDRGNNPLGLPAGFDDPFDEPIDVNGVKSGLYYTNKLDQLNRFGSKAVVFQSRFWSDRIVTTFGSREDEHKRWGSRVTRDPVTQEVLYATRNPDSARTAGNTLTAGLVVHAAPWLSFAANTSSNASPQNDIAFGPDALNLNTPLGNREGTGRDYAVRLRLFGGRVQGAITRYENDETNSQRFKAGNDSSGYLLWFNQAYISLGKPNASFNPNYITGEDTVDITSHGWETEWVVNVTRQLRFVANGSWSEVLASNQWPRITAFAEPLLVEMRANPDLPVSGVGNVATLGALANTIANRLRIDHSGDSRPIINARPYSGNLFVNYRFTEGRFAGLSVSAGVNSRGRRVIGFHTVTGNPVWDGDYSQVNCSLGYRRALRLGNRKFQWSATLAGTNVLGKRKGLLPIVGDENGIDRFAFETTPTVFLTNRFQF